MKHILAMLCFLILNIVYSQNYFQYSGSKFQSEKITLVKMTPDTIILKLYFYSSQSCACETSEKYYLTKNLMGDFFVNVNDSETDFIQANLMNGKVKSIEVSAGWTGPCCNLPTGVFLSKPVPPSGSTTTPKLQSIVAAPERFLNYWNSFQNKMKITDSIINEIEFPYIIDCSYLDQGEVIRTEFEKNGTEIYVNGNAFISGVFSNYNYPKNKNLYIGRYNDGYMSELLSTSFTNRFGNLKNIYVVSDLKYYEEGTGYKAYFRESNGTFKFIGFEGVEEGG